MKIIDGFLLSELDGGYVAVATGAAASKFNGIIRMNDTGHSIMKGLMEGKTSEEIARELVEQYDGVDLIRAKKETDGMIEKLRRKGIIEE